MIDYSITQFGKPLDKSKYGIELEKMPMVGMITEEDNLVLDFSAFEYFDCNRSLFFNIEVGNNCTVITGDGCRVAAGDNCTIITGSNCQLTTGRNCVFKTGDCCTFQTGDYCMFKTGVDCMFGGDGQNSMLMGDDFIQFKKELSPNKT